MSEKKQEYQTRKFYDPLDDFLDRPIAYNPAFKRLIGSTVGAVFFSQAWYWSKRHPDDDGWFYKTQKEWEEETGLTRYEQETARKHCGKNGAGILEEKLQGIPATLFYRVDKKKVYEKLGIQFAEIPHTSLQEKRKFGVKQQSGVSPNINKESESPAMSPDEDGKNSGQDDPLFTMEEKDKRYQILKGFYVKNISPRIVPLMDQIIRNMAITYPNVEWYEKAFEVFVKNNASSWDYLERIFQTWTEKGFGSNGFSKSSAGGNKSLTGEEAAKILMS